MLEIHTTRLRELRKFAYAREWGLLQVTTRDLLGELPAFSAVDAVITQMNRYLPIFERYHPPDTLKGRMVRELLVTLVSYGFAPEQLPDYIIGEYDTPGSGQFANGVLELCRAMQKDRPPAQRAEQLASAVANTYLAELAELYYSRYPDHYARVRANRIDALTNEYTDPDAAKIPLLLWNDPLVAARDVTLWLRLADDLETRLKAAYPDGDE